MKICHGSLAFLAFLEKNIKISVGIDISLQFITETRPLKNVAREKWGTH